MQKMTPKMHCKAYFVSKKGIYLFNVQLFAQVRPLFHIRLRADFPTEKTL